MTAQQKIEAAPASVYAKICAIQAALSRTGIAKSRRNQQQGYSFRGIDEVYAALAPLLAEHGLCVLPRILTRELIERTTAKGSPIFYVTVEAEFDFVSSDDGSTHTVRTFGEAMDTADKATNKAMSAAYKYAALMAFAIPTEGDNDVDATTHEVAARGHSQEEGAVSPLPLTDEQWAKIVQLCQATGTQGGEVKAHIGADNLRLLTPEQYDEAVAFLNDKLAAAAKAETDAKAKEPANA